MVINCPECALQVSDKAITCPHCGYPLKPEARNTYKKHKNRRRRLPNGFGQISEIKGQRLRKPFRASVTVGKNTVGKPIVRPLKPESHFATYNDAYEALVAYNKNPYDLDDTITVAELYARWTEKYFETLTSRTSQRTIISAWNYCSSVYNMRAMDIRARHIKGCMEEGVYLVKGKEQHASAGTKARIKSMFNLMLDYALEYELVDKNYARTFNIGDDIQKAQEKMRRGHITFTDEEMDILWDNVDKLQYVDLILIQCYSGWRPQELGLIEMSKVDIKHWVFEGGIKTEAGENRKVPIHSKIRHLVEKYYREALALNSSYLFNCTDGQTHRSSSKMTYDKYATRFNKLRDQLKLNPDHRAHDPRKHFVTKAKKYKVDEYAIKYMVGHAIQDITERVYTDREIAWLQVEIEKIK